MSSPPARSMLVGIDIGGTFTDGVVVDTRSGEIVTAKTPSTPDDTSRGFFDVLGLLAQRLDLGVRELLARTEQLVHGTTRGTNALVAREAEGRVGLMTTSGHGDVLQIMKGGGRTRGLPPDLMLRVARTDKPVPFVPTSLTVEVDERVDVDGHVIVPIDLAAVRAGALRLLDEGVTAIAISFLWSVVNPAHELAARGEVEQLAPSVFVTCGHELASVVGEYARASTAVMNAYVGPSMHGYVGEIERRLAEAGYAGAFLLARGGGGVTSVTDVRRSPIRTVQSGPASGVVGAAYLGRRLGREHLVTADMGGTTLDVGLVAGGAPILRERSLVERFELAQPMLDVESIGAGGGSVAWIDASGRLQVGPRSAGAVPGPACYGRGGWEPTVTDADVVIGVIDPSTYLDGRFPLDRAAAVRAFEPIADQLGLSTVEAAAGVCRLVDSRMAGLVERMTLLRGLDPRELTCVAFGGASPVHIGAIAAEAGLREVIIPMAHVSTVWSAFGAVCGDLVYDVEQPVRRALPGAMRDVPALFAELDRRAISGLGVGAGTRTIELRRFLRMRYAAQVHDLAIEVTDMDVRAGDGVLAARFREVYESTFGYGAGNESAGIDVTGLHVRASARLHHPAFRSMERCDRPHIAAARPVYWAERGGWVETPVARVEDVVPDGALEGPMLVELRDTVLVVRPGQSASFDDLGNIVLETSTSAAGSST